MKRPAMHCIAARSITGDVFLDLGSKPYCRRGFSWADVTDACVDFVVTGCRLRVSPEGA
jgi:hypothetical protein